MASFEKYKKDIPLLVEAGLIAIKQGDEDSAKKLFEGVHAIDPANPNVNMGYALIALHKMDLSVAERKFNEVIAKDKTHYQAKAFLSFTYVLSAIEVKDTQKQLSYLKKGADLAEEVINKSDLQSTRELAQSVLDWETQLQEKAQATRAPGF
ncbi:MAG: hypothetical protein KDK55_00285 [Chlamydiia bacterium]|nr:hypothetical protein [Chlamydiia bacterium]